MSQGFLIFTRTSSDHRSAAACAYSIKNKNPDAKVAMVVANTLDISEDFSEPFDDIIEYPFGCNHFSSGQLHWQGYWASPYDYTIGLSPQTLVMKNMDNEFEYLMSNHNICFPTTITNFRGERPPFTDPRYNFYDQYNLRIFYSDFFYFDKSDLSLDYFKLADPLFQNSKDSLSQVIEGQYIPDSFCSDLMHSITIKFLEATNDAQPLDDNILSYIDMDIAQYYFSKRYNQWTDYLNVWPGDHGEVKIQNFVVNNLLSYKEAQFLSEEVFNEQRNTFRSSN